MASGMMEIMDLIYGFQKFQVLYSCTSLGVFEELHRGQEALGPMSADAVATRLDLNTGALGRLMNAAVSIKLLTAHSAGPQHPTKYSTGSMVEKFVVKSSPMSLRALVNSMGDMYMMFGKLSESVRKGSCPIPMATSFGMDNAADLASTTLLIENAMPDAMHKKKMMQQQQQQPQQPQTIQKPSKPPTAAMMYKKLDIVMDNNANTTTTNTTTNNTTNNTANNKAETTKSVVLSPVNQEAGLVKKSELALQKSSNGGGIYSSHNKQLEFMQVMHMFSMKDAQHVTEALDLGGYRAACDLGGGTGAMAAHLAAAHPRMDVSVLDLPHVIASAEHFVPQHSRPNNLCFKAGDFFSCPLPTADLYILSHVIHDWSSKDVDVLLKRVYNALPKGGAVLILEKCLADSKTAPFQTVFFDVGMLVMSEGQERTAPEYRALLRRHRFSNIIVKFLPNAMYRDAIIARKD